MILLNSYCTDTHTYTEWTDCFTWTTSVSNWISCAITGDHTHSFSGKSLSTTAFTIHSTTFKRRLKSLISVQTQKYSFFQPITC